MRAGTRFPIHLLLALAAMLPALVTAAEPPPAGKFTNSECVGCHAQRDAALVAGWRASSHARTAPKADCIVCHGNTHAGAAARARRDSACLDCHEKLNRVVIHSYATSKHAVIIRLQGDAWDWSQPLARGNYRAPGCAYCHLHGAEHNTHLSVTSWDPFRTNDPSAREATLSQRQSVCGDCHAPRYVTEQTDTGLNMIEIARMKLREAREVVTRYQDSLPADDRRALDTLFAGMQGHGHNVRLGVGHQSPDYQWWNGHPALDGDLLRIKGLVGERERSRELAGASHAGK
jgi:hypothetical protein